MSACHDAIPVSESSQVGESRRRAARMAEDVGLSESERGEVAILVTELATNLVAHARQGELLLRPISGQSGGVEIISIDRGPGMADVGRCLQDGFSTAGTPGNGLGAVVRLATEFDIYSADSGTVVLARLLSKQARAAAHGSPWGVVSRPAPYETHCGDTWCIAQRPGQLSILVVDGLGHGPLAAEASRAGVTAFERDPFAPLTVLISTADAAMRGTRGGALAVAQFDAQSQMLRYAGVGNIAGSLRLSGQPGRGLVSHNGIVGVQIRKIQEFEYPCSPGALLVVHSDGLQSRWSLDPYAGLASRHPALIAGVLYRDFMRGRDDVTVGAVRFT